MAEIQAIKLIEIEMIFNGEKDEINVAETEDFKTLFPEHSVIRKLHIKTIESFADSLIGFMTTRANIIENNDLMDEALFEKKSFKIDIYLTQDNRINIVSPELKEIFLIYCSKCKEENISRNELFWEFIEAEIRDYEDRITVDIVGTFEAVEKGLKTVFIEM